MTRPVATPLVVTTPLSTTPVATTDREKLSGVAKQFEAIFLRQMLASARKSNFGDDNIFSGQGLDTFRQMQDDRFADIASETGAFGLAKMIENHLAKFVPADASKPATAVKQEAPGNGI